MDGIINLLKSPGMTSRQAVSVVKRLTGAKKIGHGGTLDPGAAGVLPVLVGKGTRLFDLVGDTGKEYIGEFTFGRETDTQDSFGSVTGRTSRRVCRQELEEVIPRFIGQVTQTPSLYSSIHIDGKRAYDYARAGASVVMPSRQVTIHELELLDKTGAQSYLFRISCGKGTYIRSLCVDFAAALGSVAYLSFLLRTKAGGLSIENSVTLDELEEKVELMDLKAYVKDVPRLTALPEYDNALLNGVRLPQDAVVERAEPGVRYCMYTSGGRLVGMASFHEDAIVTKVNLKTD